ncbi:phosphonate ABC transporter, permease protein PhnE [Caldalkalibacillus salinus]|uniref:phosphonate ABC transporter, permease protein PhnE n=1 Tax=Caldalkalibacillus salinus TaxID=2803787 RepID=UPI001EFFD1BC|nr:phosphonate ABC transporter, permease protein PhnE [Caldalkalibacillus salinus]
MKKRNSMSPRAKFWTRLTVSALIMASLYTIAFAFTDLNMRKPDATFISILRRMFVDSWLNIETISEWIETGQLLGPLWNADVFADVPRYLSLMIETICIAFVGTLMGAVLAFPVAFFASNNMVGRFSFIGKNILSFIRAFPELVFAIIFVFAVGIGPFAGVLAIGINSIGMLGKLYSEVIESIDKSVLEALRSSGANQAQVIWYGVIPQIIPECLSYVIYRYEIDLRSSTVLGIVGAGGIGVPLMLYADNRNWEHVGMMLIIIILTITIVDYLSAYIRRRIV